MKKILFAIMIIPVISNGQLPFNTQVNNWRSYNNSVVSTATAAHSLTPNKIGAGIGDSLAKYIIALKDTTFAALSMAGDLESVTTLGNTTDQGILMYDQSLTVQQSASPFQSIIYGYDHIGVFNPLSTHFTSILPSSFTSDHFQYIADEGGVSDAVGSTISLHKTASPSLWGSGTMASPTTGFYISSSKFDYYNSGTVIAKLENLGGGYSWTLNGISGGNTLVNWDRVYSYCSSGTGEYVGFRAGSHPYFEITDPTLNSIYIHPSTVNSNRHDSLIDASGKIPITASHVDLSAQTTSVSNFVSYTTNGTYTYEISSYINVTAVVAATVGLNVGWTDQNGNAQSISLGSATTTAGSPNRTICIRARIGTSVTVSSSIVGTSATYDCGASVKQLY